MRVDVLPSPVDRGHDAGHARQAEGVRLDGHDDPVTRHQGRQRQVAESRRRVDENDVPIARQPNERPDDGQPGFVAAVLARRNETRTGRDQMDPWRRRGHDEVRDADGPRRVFDEPACRLDAAEPFGRRALRIEVHDEHAQAALGERRGQADRRGRLAAAALVVRDGDDPHLAVAFHSADERIEEVSSDGSRARRCAKERFGGGVAGPSASAHPRSLHPGRARDGFRGRRCRVDLVEACLGRADRLRAGRRRLSGRSGDRASPALRMIRSRWGCPEPAAFARRAPRPPGAVVLARYAARSASSNELNAGVAFPG